ncbi:MAG: RidA family protein [Paludibacteraceae bacterium]|nr:RidA family protein [Paludibacteraceae bacterium]MBP3717634.1 RidA family protein [Paludibacteraceae bacterium]
MRKIIETQSAPAAIGPYSQAVMVDSFLYVSGQLGLNPKTGNLEGDNIQSQTKQSLSNIKAILGEAGYDFSNVVKTTVFLSDIALFADFNAVYSEAFPCNAPARSCVAVKGLPKNALVEIEVVAHK